MSMTEHLDLKGTALLLTALAGGCSSAPKPAAVAPAELPGLVAQTEREPRNAALKFRLAATLAAARRCDSAVVVARAAQRLEADNVRGPLVVGACQEQAGRYDEAIATYQEFASQHPRAQGVAALTARAKLALRTSAEQTARQALARETELAQQPPQAATVAVLPVLVAGDSTYRPLSRGLAELITTDLAYIRTLKLLERLQIGVLLDELKLGTSARADPATAARVGRLLRAERMVQGTVTIPSAGAGSVQLTASVVTGAGVVRPVAPATGPLQQLLGLEKQVVFALAAQLGIELTEAERQRILKEGPRQLAAFLAYSRGLEAMDAGDYSRAARHFGEAARVDPGFRAASQDRQAAQTAPALERAGADPVGSLAAVDALGHGGATVLPATGGVLSSGTLDVVPTPGDVVAQAGGTASGTATTIRHLGPETAGLPSIISVTNGITIIFKRPP
jgi:tetratricopeptide (TPR) repeat protein